MGRSVVRSRLGRGLSNMSALSRLGRPLRPLREEREPVAERKSQRIQTNGQVAREGKVSASSRWAQTLSLLKTAVIVSSRVKNANRIPADRGENDGVLRIIPRG